MASNGKNRDLPGIGGDEDANPLTQVSPGWREYQRRLQRDRAVRRRKRTAAVAVLLALPACLLLYVFLRAEGGGLAIFASPETKSRETSAAPEKPVVLEKARLRDLLAGGSLLNLEEKSIEIRTPGGTVLVETSLDMDLQKFLLETMNTDHARQIAMVAMDPEKGTVLAMVGHDKENAGNNPCLDSRFLAASVFKIVTAAAAVERLGLTQESPLSYNGRKYTLYKSQLKDRNNKYTRHVTLEESFADSINPVFGKLGTLELKKENLEAYGEAFGFNAAPEFELAVGASRLSVSDKPYNWAEIASGFNRETTLSPLHAAMMVSAVANDGEMPDPAIVRRVSNEPGEVLYRFRRGPFRRVAEKETSAILRDLMRATVESGTSRRVFRGREKDSVLSKLEIGGKTGSIDDKAHEARIDWFAGFAYAGDGGKKLAVAVVVAHQEYIGVRAAVYAKKAIARYFGNVFARAEDRKAG